MDNSINKFSPTDRMADLVRDDYRLLQVMTRFGISLGFGDKSVHEVCALHGVDTATFLTVANFMQEEDELVHSDVQSLSIPTMMNYLKRAHSYYLDFCLPTIRRKLVEAIDWQPIDAIEEEELNLIAILKDCPIGTKLYSTLHGEVKYRGLTEEGDNKFPINCTFDVGVDNLDLGTCCFNEKGKSIESFYYGECVLFPSREQRDWTKFKINN
jgi:regulator of cell morphogenesis and NO signaling